MNEQELGFSPHPKIEEHIDFLILHFMEWSGAHLSDCSRVFEGDLTEMMVLTVIGQAFVRHYGYRAAQIYQLDGEELTVSAARISEITSIPRETVRRKLHSLMKRGWVEQAQNGKWKFVMDGASSVAARELIPLQMRSLTRLMNLIDTINEKTNP
jgi:hypothetical protein